MQMRPDDPTMATGGPLVTRLQDELAEARRDLADLEREFSVLADPEVLALDDEHDSEGCTVGFERARVAGLIERARRRIADLQAATRRAGDGSYQSCEACGGRIADERLAALPSTRLCIRCARAKLSR